MLGYYWVSDMKSPTKQPCEMMNGNGGKSTHFNMHIECLPSMPQWLYTMVGEDDKCGEWTIT